MPTATIDQKDATELLIAMNMLVNRCSRFSGWKLDWRIETDGKLFIWDPQEASNKSWLLLKVSKEFPLDIYEVTGRMRFWGITYPEQRTILRYLQFRNGLPVSDAL